jgi:hypothetical protein
VGLLPLVRQTRGKPVRLATGIVVDVLESEGFEPHRGSCAQVSLIVEAINDDRSNSLEASSRGRVELVQGDIDRSRKMELSKV